MRAYFSRKAPLFFVTHDDDDRLMFDAVAVEVDEVVMDILAGFYMAMKKTRESFEDHGAPEDYAQQEADEFARQVRMLFKTRKQTPLNMKDNPYGD